MVKLDETETCTIQLLWQRSPTEVKEALLIYKLAAMYKLIAALSGPASPSQDRKARSSGAPPS